MRLIIATHNKGKLAEFSQLLAPYAEAITSAGMLGLKEPEETGVTFSENAILKAKAASLATGNLALADDSGLCVHALNDRPGLYSARWAGPEKDFNLAMRRIHNELGNAPDRSAHFICVLALYQPDGHCEIFEGRIDGVICWPPRGDHGHGYDPIFVPDGETRTFAEMSDHEKNTISHRARALTTLIKRFQQ